MRKAQFLEVIKQKPVNKAELRAHPNSAISQIGKRPITATHKTPSKNINELAAILSWLLLVTLTVLKSALSASAFILSSIFHYLKGYPGHALLITSLTISIIVLAVAGSNLQTEFIERKTSLRTIDELIASSKFTRDYTYQNISALGTREILRVGGPSWLQRRGVQAILSAARQAGLSIEHQAVLLATAEVESGFNPMARAATTSACGLFQFVKATGKKFGLNASQCFDPQLNAAAGVKHYVQNYQNKVEAQVADLSGSEKLLKMYELTYYLHHDGPLSKNPSNDVKAVVLSGTEYLFKAYAILQAHEQRKQAEPDFSDVVSSEFQVLTNKLGLLFGFLPDHSQD